MLDIKQIESFYPESLRAYRKSLLREYLQYKILEIIFNSEFAGKLSFMGGTAIHILHGNSRFSEDLDFDNISLARKEFLSLSALINDKLKLEGHKIEVRNIFTKKYGCYIKFNEILFRNSISGHKDEKLVIRIDAEPQIFKYQPEKVILNKFDVFLMINTVPVDILLSQKLYAILNRRRSMGRDFFDMMFLAGRIKPNKDYLKSKIKIKGIVDLKNKLLNKCRKLDFKALKKDVEPFLYNSQDAKKVLLFKKFMEDYKF